MLLKHELVSDEIKEEIKRYLETKKSWTQSKSWTIKKAKHGRIDPFYCGVGEDSLESLGLQGDQTSQS